MREGIVVDPNLDLPSPEVSEQQARSFCVRVLRKIAVRLSGGNRYWQEVDVSLAVETGEYPDYALHIRALQEDIDDVDDEIAPETYCVELMHNEPVFAASDEVLVSSLQNQWEPDEDQLYDEDFDEGEEEGEFEIVGHMRVTEKIFFSVFKKGSGCDVLKAVDYSFIDDEEDIVGYELGFRTNVLTNQEIPEEDLEYLYKFGEVMLDTRAREAEQSSVTIADLEKILMHIKNAGLVSKRLKTIR